MKLHQVSLAVAVLFLFGSGWTVGADETENRIRRPVAIALSVDGHWLYTANQASGSVSMVDTAARAVTGELTIGGRPADIVAIDDSHLLVLDEQNHQLVLLKGNTNSWNVAARLNVAEHPVRICLDRESHSCYVTSLWSRVVTQVDISGVDQHGDSLLKIRKQIQISFEPREICLSPDRQLVIVAGSFTNEIAMLDSGSLNLISENQIPGHNIRGMTVGRDGKRLLLAHQRLNPLARSTRDDVHWGNMVANVLVSLPLETIRESSKKMIEPRDVRFLGEPGSAAGDPGSIAVGVEGELLIAFSGVNELAIEDGSVDGGFKRIRVGANPVSIASLTDEVACVANKYSDSISIVDRDQDDVVTEISLGPQPELSLAELGEKLFFDSRLSHDGWMSCHSCHTDGHSNGQLNDNFSDGSFIAPKRVLSLMGVSETGPWAWNGEVKSLSNQVRKSIEVTMQGSEPTEKQVAAIVAYLKTIPAPPAGSLATDQASNPAIARGRKLFESLECQQCHIAPTYTSPLSYDVGLADAAGNRTFNPPSLRGVGSRKTLFHDASAHSLQDVLVNSKHQLSRTLTSEELESLVAFLQSI